ncbi:MULTISPECIES: Wzz/FepE/Etk N-terminal domain-containing protein [unclassified Pseudomonas]|uniref:Wzz/FepE/Etk N-terminal domain-containing protein n=1 Tax=unclassified Pseudomonas TaxID=196821 RepID=UPI000C88BFB6|nr:MULTISPECIES: Wzz/FepE/Etk N-terminal domain-containing protein [unclassified Pseudomonas]PMZ86909.1 chain-length determining protein [Pseudomonas sp. FW215-T2]PNA09160.1 chain-length determining protein [Pseudomonas sp. FW215-R3]PNB38720.1 chain-length determining protein [Pseudomonas sp. FW305-131]
MNIPVNTIDTPRQEVVEVKELIGSLWDQRAIILLFTALTVTAAIAYALLATPEYEVETTVRPVPLADLDELNESGLYKLLPKDALNIVGSSMQSYDVRLKFFQANPQYLAPLQAPGQSIESAFETFNEKAFSLEKIDPKKSSSLSEAVGLSLRYPQGIDGVGILRDFTDFVVKGEKEKVASNLKTLIANRIDQAEKKLESKKSAYEAEKDSKIAHLLEKDQLKKQVLQDELKALRQQLQSRRQNRIKELDEAIVIAKKLGIVKPTTPSALGDGEQAHQGNMIRTEVNNQKIPLYFLGQAALEAERATLVARHSDDFTEPRIDEIQKELSLLATNREAALLKERNHPELFLKDFADISGELTHLKQLNVNFDQLKLVNIDKDATEPQAPIKPKKALIVGFGLIFGFMLGLGVAIIRRAVLSLHSSRR